MSRAFVKEEVEAPSRSGRHRSASGLPPGALNYLTTFGADYLRREAAELREQGEVESASQIDELLANATVVAPPKKNTDLAVFGSRVTLKLEDGSLKTYGIVGVDELHFHNDAVTWVSPLGRMLLGAELGQRILPDEGPMGTIVAIEPI